MRKGTKHSLKTRAKMSKKKSGENHPFWGRHRSKETRRKISKKKTGSHHSEETKEKMSLSHTGVKLSEEHKRKILKGRLGFKHTEKTKQKISITRTERKKKLGYLNSPDARKKMSIAHIGENAYNWKGGPVSYGSDWSRQRRKVWERDDYICQCCELGENGKKNDVHHWIPYRLSHDNDLDNLITLCHQCHIYIEYHFIVDFPNLEDI